MALEIASLALGELVTSKKGTKSVPLTSAGQPLAWLPEAQHVLFEPKSFNGESRVNLVMKASPSVVETLDAFDEQVVQLCFAESQRLFGRSLSLEEVRMRYNPCLKQSDKGYEPTFKAKIGLEGSGAVKCWNADATPRKIPPSWTGCAVRPRIVFRCLWFMPTAFGCLLECSDALISEGFENKPRCPF